MTELKKMLENFFEKNSKTFENRNPGVISLHCHSNNKVLLLREKDAFYFEKEAVLLRESKKCPKRQPYGKLSLAKHLDYWRKTIIFA